MGKLLISKGVVLIERDAHSFTIETLKGLPKTILGSKIQIDDLPGDPEFIDKLPPSPWQAFLRKNSIELVIPIIHSDDKLGLIGFGKKILGSDYSDSDLEYLNSLSNIAATAIQNSLIHNQLKEVNWSLDKKNRELYTIKEIGEELNANLFEPEKVVSLLAYSIMGELMVNRCLIFLNVNGKLVLNLNKGFSKDEIDKIEQDKILLKALSTLESPLNILEADDSEFAARSQELGVTVLVPMRMQQKMKGVIALGEKITKAPFIQEELDFLTTLGNSSIISIENALLFKEMLEKKRLEEELQIASDIQKQLLPDSSPQLERYEIAADNVSSLHVGGDYFDCIKIEDNLYSFCIADVSGKGAPAALLMSNLQASLHALINTGLRIDEITFRINNLIYRNTTYDKFITFFLGVLNLSERTFTSVNAGHNPPYLFHKDGTFQNFEEGGLILGMMPNIQYDTETVSLESGDCIVMFTDGVSEAMNSKEEEFEEKRIEACVLDNYDLSAEGILQTLKKAVYDFAQDQPQADDITIQVIKIF
ncbi:MAG: GAF domain-containing SpoIIE family protein phosphatase [bacterium]